MSNHTFTKSLKHANENNFQMKLATCLHDQYKRTNSSPLHSPERLNHRIMSSISFLKLWCSFFTVLALSTTRCKSDEIATGIIGRALACFDDQAIYQQCQESYRLTAAGTVHVPKEAADMYCDGPCLSETKLVLSCVNDILYNFRFYNGASVRNVRYTLDVACGHSSRRGDFDVAEHLGEDPYAFGDYGGYYGHANKFLHVVPAAYLLIVFSFVLLL